MLPMTRLNHARTAYINTYGKEDFYNEVQTYLKSTGKTTEQIIKEETENYGIYDLVFIHLRLKAKESE